MDRSDDLLAPPASPEELAAAEALRAALDSGAATKDAELLRALALAHSPRPLDAAAHERLITDALARPAPRRGNVVRVAFGASALVALAASVALYLASHGQQPRPAAQLASVRSTQELFDRPFEAGSRASARVDRIAISRQADLRDNRFARWGVR